MNAALTEDALVQRTIADYLETQLGWESAYAWNRETFGPDGTLGRESERDVLLLRPLLAKLQELNPGLPDTAYHDAAKKLAATNAAQTTLATNREKHDLLRDGIQVSFRDENGRQTSPKLRVFDFDNPEANHFLCVRELWVKGNLYRRRADIVGFVNGVPLLFVECKNVNKPLEFAYEQNFKDYIDDKVVPHLFHHNAFVVLSNGLEAKIGAITSPFGRFANWKRLAEEDAGTLALETLLKGVCEKRNFLDLFENFILFDDSAGQTSKILARNHQFLGVNRAAAAVADRQNRDGKLGVFWHTQGAGKSYSMVFLSRKVHRKLGGNFTFLVCTDREDLDGQIYKTFAGCGLADNDRDPCRAANAEHLEQLLKQQKAFVFTLIQKFHKEVAPDAPYTRRDDIIVISDEAHRTQYGELALNLRNALPNAAYIGFTGTPLFKDDELTRRVFGEYVSTYDFQRAVEDNATVPLYYDPRGEKLRVTTTDINERIAERLNEWEPLDIDAQQRLDRELARDYHILTAASRLDDIAKDFVSHYAAAWETGKAMFVCIDKITCVRMFRLIEFYWAEAIKTLEASLNRLTDDQEAIYRRRQIAWMKETRMAVVVSEEQGEVEKFEKWELDILPHRRLMKTGFELPDGGRVELEAAFKNPDHPFRIAIVCAMWLTGFDVPSLSNLYLDKPLKAHTLMQAMARANRVHEGKNNGLVVDYCGILANLRSALATYANGEENGGGGGGGDPTHPEDELLTELEQVIQMARDFLAERGASLDAIGTTEGMEALAAIAAAKEAVNQNDETRKRFELVCREVFRKFKFCLTFQSVHEFRPAHRAVKILYQSLMADREKADIADILRDLHRVVEDAIQTRPTEEAGGVAERASKPYDISRIDFDRLRAEFARSPARRTVVQNLRQALEERLRRLLERNPSRTDFQERFEALVERYNSEKDRLTIEQTFEELTEFISELGEEESRAMREGLDEESLALFDILKKDELSADEIKRIKKVARELLDTLKAEHLRMERWTEKTATRDGVHVAIHNFLYSDDTGLPVERYSDEDVETLSDAIFQHIFAAYPAVPSPVYATG
ncbi:MAG: type I restriction endonuclease subunit R [Desulfococcaceae bacterium]